MVRKGIPITLAIVVCIFTVASVSAMVHPEAKNSDVASSAWASPVPSLSPSPTAKPAAAPTVTFTQWHTNQPVIPTPANRLADIPPVLQITTPENQTTIKTENLTLTVNVASYFWTIDSVYCKTDWQPEIHQLFGIQPSYIDSLNANITAAFPLVPTVTHTVTIYANTHDDMHTQTTVTFTRTS